MARHDKLKNDSAFREAVHALRACLSSNINRLPWLGWPASPRMQCLMEAWLRRTEGECGMRQQAKPQFTFKYLIY